MVSWHLHSSLLGLGLLKLKLLGVQTALQLVILQHRINATALLLYLLLLSAACGGICRYAQANRAGFTHHRQRIEHWRFRLLIGFRLSIIVLDPKR
ncbi:hypothetical protein HR12_05860 [Microbacterium sp. SUBG005]|nr:hypothetical protein HR12_05860 [Microbacterium sp. SUBG005]